MAVAEQPILQVRDVAVYFGGIVALDGVSFDLRRSAILGLIGPNGAGKTTLFNCLSRLYIPNAGDILYEGRNAVADQPAPDCEYRYRADIPEPGAIPDHVCPRQCHGRCPLEKPE